MRVRKRKRSERHIGTSGMEPSARALVESDGESASLNTLNELEQREGAQDQVVVLEEPTELLEGDRS